jgi:hypothetical protein
MFTKNLVSLFPMKSIVKNNGFGDSLGENCGGDYRFVDLPYYEGEKLFNNPPLIEVDSKIEKAMRKTYEYDVLRSISHFLSRNGIAVPKKIKKYLKSKYKL